jgi:hypothetical protein
MSNISYTYRSRAIPCTTNKIRSTYVLYDRERGPGYGKPSLISMTSPQAFPQTEHAQKAFTVGARCDGGLGLTLTGILTLNISSLNTFSEFTHDIVLRPKPANVRICLLRVNPTPY